MSNEVFPIKDKRDFAKMKKALTGRDQLLLTLGTAFGLRISDLLTLKVGDLRGQDSLTIIEQKRKKNVLLRSVCPLNKRLRISKATTRITYLRVVKAITNRLVAYKPTAY